MKNYTVTQFQTYICECKDCVVCLWWNDTMDTHSLVGTDDVASGMAPSYS